MKKEKSLLLWQKKKPMKRNGIDKMSTEFEERKEYILGLTLDDMSKYIHYKGKQIDENLSKEELLEVILYLYKREQLAINLKNTMCEECKAEDERGIEW